MTEGIVVLGSPRSGTTLVRRLLSAHPHIHCPPETNLLSACARFLEEVPSSQGMSIGVRSGLAYSGIAEEDVLERLRAMVLGIHRELAAKAGKPRWAEKTAFDAFHLDTIEELLGDRVRYVLVYRHGLDVVTSMKDLSDEMETYLPEVHRYVQQHLSPLVGFAHAWVDVSRRLLRFERDHAGACVRLRYEDLVADPAAEMGRVFAALGEETDAAAVVAAATAKNADVGLGDWKTHGTTSVSAKSVGRWSSLSPSTLVTLADVVNPTLVELGYPAVEPPPAPSGADARRKYQINAAIARMKAQR